jgi:hypothetical protein
VRRCCRIEGVLQRRDARFEARQSRGELGAAVAANEDDDPQRRDRENGNAKDGAEQPHRCFSPR